MNLFIRLFFLVFPLVLYGEIPLLTFHDLQDDERWNGKEINIKGFLYFDGKTKWILSSEPHLKSCCVGSKEKKFQQIVLEGKYNQSWNHHVVEATGILDVVDVYSLKNAKVSLLKTQSSYSLWFIVIIIGIICVLVSIWRS